MTGALVIPLNTLLAIANQVRTEGFLVDVQQTADRNLVIALKVAEVAVRGGAMEGVLLDEIHVSIEGLSDADLKTPGRDLLEKVSITVHHFAVRISRDWLNTVIERGPFLRGAPVRDVQIVFNERNKNQLIVRGSAKGLPFETTLLIGIENNQVVVEVDDVRVLGFLPVPGWLRNLVTSVINVADKVNRPGVTFHNGVTRIDPTKLAPLPVRLRMARFETSGEYIVLEGGEV